MGENVNRLQTRLADVVNLRKAAALLTWDQLTQMPPGGAPARGRQLATLARLAHEMFTADETGALLDRATEEVKHLPADSNDAAMVRVTRRELDKARKLPASLISELAQHQVEANEIWVKARADNDFPSFIPSLQRSIDLSRQVAEHLGYEDDPYDALLDQFEPGMKASQVKTIFNGLRQEVVPLVKVLSEHSDRVSDAVLHQPYDEGRQEAFGRMVVAKLGYDFSRGREDRTVHPFAIAFSVNDVRITTRFEPEWLSPALFGTIHEAGHAMYEQGFSQDLDGTVLAEASSMAIHESQSRLWENVVGRSRPFWSHFYAQLQDTFPAQLGGTDLDSFYRAINTVEPSLIRVEADEVTYTLHIMLRFEMELGLLSGEIPVTDAAEVWNQKMEEYLGIVPETDTLGVLQDTHWASGLLGYFPTYALGTVISLQFWEAALAAHPEIPAEIGQGQFGTLLRWLQENVYRFGAKLEPGQIIERATGRPLETGPYVRYLKEKYGGVYGL